MAIGRTTTCTGTADFSTQTISWPTKESGSLTNSMGGEKYLMTSPFLFSGFSITPTSTTWTKNGNTTREIQYVTRRKGLGSFSFPTTSTMMGSSRTIKWMGKANLSLRMGRSSPEYGSNQNQSGSFEFSVNLFQRVQLCLLFHHHKFKIYRSN